MAYRCLRLHVSENADYSISPLRLRSRSRARGAHRRRRAPADLWCHSGSPEPTRSEPAWHYGLPFLPLLVYNEPFLTTRSGAKGAGPLSLTWFALIVRFVPAPTVEHDRF